MPPMPEIKSDKTPKSSRGRTFGSMIVLASHKTPSIRPRNMVDP